MPTLKIDKLHRKETVEQGKNLMDSLIDLGVPVASSCDGEGVCGMCRVQVVSGVESLPPLTDIERRLLSSEDQKNSYRLSCQCTVTGDLSLATTYW
ncbi:MAG: (2Fe-2S)-binding protein [Bdellovibrionales bacterium]|nr:(2Fe-2S)-binding protein [Bdellovibrionales bacterium]